MSNTNAFVFPIGNQTSGNQNINFEKQMSPSWVLTFVRFYYRDLLRTPGSSPATIAGNQPLIVQSDCVQLEISTVKNNLTPNIKMVLVQTDIDYETALAPGDFVLANILNWDSGNIKTNNGNQSISNENINDIFSGESSADDIANRVQTGLNINRIQDGFKGVFRIQSVRKNISVDPTSGIKLVRFEVTGFAFTEFNNALYFNQNLVNQNVSGNFALFAADISKAWASLNTFQGTPYVQELIASLIRIFLGSGPSLSASGQNIQGTTFSFNNQYIIPGLVGTLLGLNNQANIQARDLYTYLFGIQQYSANVTDPVSGLNPSNVSGSYPNIKQRYPNFFYTKDYCPGNSTLKPDYWNNVKLWSVLNQYTNSPLNELFTCFRVSFNGNVLPTVVFRQIPFTNDDFATQKFGTQDSYAPSIKVTKFMNIPRWKISPYYIYSLNIGREESARINFVQYFAKCLFTKNGIDLSLETAKGNYCFDSEDVKRSGLKPYIINNEFNDLLDQSIEHAPQWARIIADASFGGHLKLNGTIECIGIYEPITVGDNLEFNNVVYHIEGIIHKCVINEKGFKTFRTIITLSNGLAIGTSSTGVHYAQMYNENAYDERTLDYDNNQILPGVSESQDTVERDGNIDQISKTNLQFPEPNEDNR
jgi:hypothetical protein